MRLGMCICVCVCVCVCVCSWALQRVHCKAEGLFGQHLVNTGAHVWHSPPCVAAAERRAADRSVAEGPVAHQSS